MYWVLNLQLYYIRQKILYLLDEHPFLVRIGIGWMSIHHPGQHQRSWKKNPKAGSRELIDVWHQPKHCYGHVSATNHRPIVWAGLGRLRAYDCERHVAQHAAGNDGFRNGPGTGQPFCWGERTVTLIFEAKDVDSPIFTVALDRGIWYASHGCGSWPKLSEHTVRMTRKTGANQGSHTTGSRCIKESMHLICIWGLVTTNIHFIYSDVVVYRFSAFWLVLSHR